jgi:hypothetical protein
MEKIIITCDFCKKELGDQHIKIGSENGSELYYVNTLPSSKAGETRYIDQHSDLHFCSKEHFIKYFLG